MAQLTQKYVDLVSQAIADFDTIFNALASKGVEKDGVALGTGSVLIDNGSVKTSEYAGLISKQLYRVQGVDGVSSTVVAPGGVIANYDGANKSLANSGIKYNADSIVISGNITDSGYYGTTSALSATLTGATASISGAAPTNGTGYTVVGATDKLTVAPVDNYVLKSIEIKKGSVGVALSEANIDATVNSAATAAIVTGGSIDNAVLDAAAQDGAYTIKVKASSTYTAEISSTSGVSLTTPGYVTEIENADAVAEKSIKETAGNAAEYFISIPKATVSGITGSGAADLTLAGALATVDNAADGYEVKATGTITVDTKNAQINSGYISSSDKIEVSGTPSVTAKSLYIKKGNVGNAAGNAAEVNVNVSGVSLSGDKYVATATVDQKYSHAIESGYVEADTYEANITGSGKLEMNKAAAAVTTTGTSLVKSGDAIFSEAEIAGGYKLTVNATTEFDRSLTTEGYLGDVAQIVKPDTATASKDYYIAKGSVTANTTLSTVVKSGSGSVDGAEGTVSIFVAEKDLDKTRDYYEITATPSAVVNNGYVTGFTAGETQKSFLPKATLKFVENSEAGNFLQVEKGGYLPSGLIAEIAEITGEMDYASVSVGIGNDFDKTVTGDYTLSLVQGAIDAGYISSASLSDGKGELKLNNTYKVAHAAATLENTSAVELGNVVAKGNGYAITASGNATAKFTLTKEGYIKIADVAGATIDGNVATIVAPHSDEIELAKAVVAIPEASKVTLSSANNTVLAGDTTSPYYVKPVISNGNVVANTTTAGYISTSDKHNLTVTAEEAVVYIKPGVKYESVANVSADTNTALQFSGTEENGVFKAKLASYEIPVTGTIEEGYYKGAAATVTGKATVAAKEVSIAKAAVSVSQASGQADVNATEVVLHDSNADATKKFVGVTASGVASATANVDTAGYIKDKSQVTVNAINVASKTKYIEVFNQGETEIEGDNYNVITVGGQASGTNETSMVLPTAAKYVENNTEIRLHADAMGSAVESKLAELEARLAGR